jgi:hypothetical protein
MVLIFRVTDPFFFKVTPSQNPTLRRRIRRPLLSCTLRTTMRNVKIRRWPQILA